MLTTNADSIPVLRPASPLEWVLALVRRIRPLRTARASRPLACQHLTGLSPGLRSDLGLPPEPPAAHWRSLYDTWSR